MFSDRMTLDEARKLLEVSRPTLNEYRKKYRLKFFKLKNRVYLSKTEIIKKILLSTPISTDIKLTIFEADNCEQIQPLPGMFELRRFAAIDVYGVLSLLCTIKSFLKTNPNEKVFLIVDDSWGCSYLEASSFFNEATRGHINRVFYNGDELKRRENVRSSVILPLHLVGYRGAEKKILDELYTPLLKQGFTEDYCGHIGWILGELCDNAHTHSEGPCYLIIEPTPSEITDTRHLTIAVGDIGVGIQNSLRKNDRYKQLSDEKAFAISFKSKVSRMEVEPKRGKGLNDILSLAKGNSSCLRVESNDIGIFFDFRNAYRNISYVSPRAEARGTRACVVLIDNEVKNFTREEIDHVMDTFMETV